MKNHVVALISLVALGCSPPPGAPGPTPNQLSTDVQTPLSEPTDTLDNTRPSSVSITLIDHSASSNFTGEVDGHFERGRSCAPGDFDGDGRLDVVIGNPGDTTHIMLNRSEGPGHFLWERGQTLSDGRLTWSLGVADFDNDGDPDIVAGNGGNEDQDYNQLFRNDNGLLVDITPPEVAGPDNKGVPLITTTAGVVWADFDNDGKIDLFLSSNILPKDPFDPSVPTGINQFMLGDGNGSFSDVTRSVGLAGPRATANSIAFDSDNDGYMDIFENNNTGPNFLWLNQLDSGSAPHFLNVTDSASATPDIVGVEEPYVRSFSSAAADFNQDGNMDMIVWQRGPASQAHPHEGHLVWIMVPGQGFVNMAKTAGINANREWLETDMLGVMGSQVGDLNLDGIPDMFVGTGGPISGNENELWISSGMESVMVPDVGMVETPTYEDKSYLIRKHVPGTAPAAYPYRTHGACIADYDGDGRPELLYVNGGPSYGEDTVREPNRLFQVVAKVPNHFLNIRPVGNGTTSNRDGVGTQVEVKMVLADGSFRTSRDTLLGGNGFSSQNGPELIVGLGQATEIHSVQLTWPDGEVELLQIDEVDQKFVVHQNP